MYDLNDWLSKPPKYTTFRINILRQFEHENLKKFLLKQSKELNCAENIPNFYLLRPDCLVIEQWPNDLKLEKGAKHVVVDALCAAAVLRGAHVFAPGVMGVPSGSQKGDIVDIYGDITGQCKRGLKVGYDGKKQYVGTGILKMTRNDLFENGVQPSGIAVHTLLPASRLPVINETLYPKGAILLQNLPSIVCGWVVNAQPNEVILDMCAAPGNKTTHLAEMSNNEAIIIALDKTQQKVAAIKNNYENHGITCINAYAFDSTKCFSEKSNGIDLGPPFPSNSFDKILLDAPCSGLGQRPQLLNKMTPKMLQSYKFVQRKLLKSAVEVLKVGGKLTYSTCTVTEDENEGIVSWALEMFPCLSLVSAEPLLGGPGLPNCGLTEQQRAMVQRFNPTDDSLRIVDPIYKDTIGFFIAQFIKTNPLQFSL
ncbi:tRNA (cytosine(72)-C(5))-methyltransferase NSUN6 [Plodia interpunctella]|uniref:tRNA (cytosine(72)-C(5))-methyltransferase NSUN6 n=1 Tax=Plodia interpunctella TaxID=58824 RepID=UPI002368B4E7|nr:tRNA (cytosine(72)-C(5))-methyltransferase NSUN6 [Plodia interpunctella]